jgi:alkanesulfonate monooxygenase SsuD/methylene tetrahydromethanopterin reductase-like flavin-dependent oxidoreductase (luciferase family)
VSTEATPVVFGPGTISLRLYPHDASPADVVRILARQATVAVDNGFDGVLVSEGHGVRTNVPNPLQVAGWLLEAMPAGWAAPCPLLLPLRPALIVAEEVAWLGARFPGRVGIGVAVGGHRDQFEALGQSFDGRVDRFRAELPLLVDALTRGAGPLAGDAAVAHCHEHPIPVVSAALSPAAVDRAVHAGAGIVGDSLSTPERTRALLARYTAGGGTGPRVVIRRVWIGARPLAREAEQLAWYRSAAPASAMKFWGDADQTIVEPTGEVVAARLLELLDDVSSPEPPALNLRVHVAGLAPEVVEEQVVRLGEEVLPRLRAHQPAAVTSGSGPPPAQRAG